MNRHRIEKPFGYSTILDGSSQLWLNAAPVNMDFNGSELITATTDRGFETDVGTWIDGGGNHSIAQSADFDKSGTKSGKITATGAGDATTNYVSLPYAGFTTLVSGNKYTFETWAYGDTNGVTLAIVIGDKSVTGKVVYSAVAGTFVKVVFDFQATASTVGQDIQLYLSGAGLCYIDDVSLTQAYDFLGIAAFKLTDVTDQRFVMGKRPAGVDKFFNLLVVNASGVLSGYITDGVIAANPTSASSVATGNWTLGAVTYDRVGNAQIYVDGSASGLSRAMTGIGNMSPSLNEVSVGAVEVGTYMFPGPIGPTSWIRFSALPSDIATTIAYINATWKRQGFPKSYAGGTVVLDIDWKNNGADSSASGNHLTGTGSPPIIKTRF